MILAHIVVGDRLIAEAAARVIAGQARGFDNRAALSETYLRAMIDAERGWHGLLHAVQRGGEELSRLAEAMTDLRHHFAVETALMIPVPLHSSKLRSRGFNQSELIAESAVSRSTIVRFLMLSPMVESS